VTPPFIALTSEKTLLPAELNTIRKVLSGCDIRYANAVAGAGGLPFIVPVTDFVSAPSTILEHADGLLLTGGGDVTPHLYREQPHGTLKLEDFERDNFERTLVLHALKLGLPILGICRGMQILNVAMGGTLYQDIGSMTPKAGAHVRHGISESTGHSANIMRKSLLFRITGKEHLTLINSTHHQAVHRVGNGLRVSCTAPDGIIEGIEASDDSPILGVQFHPERLIDTDSTFSELFRWLVEEATLFREKRSKTHGLSQ
jgi:putative glutamine amidotransferase